jgi:hypothetical protein
MASAALTTGAMTLVPMALAPPPAGALSAPRLGFTAFAYGTEMKNPTAVESGYSALAWVGCTTKAGLSRDNTVTGVNLTPAGKVGSVDSHASTGESSSGTQEAKSSASTAEVSLFGGEVKASAVSVSTVASETAAGAGASRATASFVSLTIDGKALKSAEPANTKVAIPNVGFAVLNEQGQRVTSTGVSGYVIGLDAHVTNPSSPLYGTRIVVSAATASLHGPVSGVLGGLSYGTEVNSGSGVIESGPTYSEPMSCYGTAGRTREDAGSGSSYRGLKSGATTDTVKGTDTASALAAYVTSSVADLHLDLGPGSLTDALGATAIKSVASAYVKDGKTVLSEKGSDILGLTILGHSSESGTPPPNTKIQIPGVGTLYLNKVVKTANSITVEMIDLQVTTSAPELAGDTLVAGYARAKV